MRNNLVYFLVIVSILSKISCQIVSSCENNISFTYIEESMNFEEAVLECELIQATLAILPDGTITRSAVDFLNSINAKTVWIGLRRLEESTLGGANPDEPSTFFFIDETLFVDNFASVRGNFPWANNRPKNTNGREVCVR